MTDYFDKQIEILEKQKRKTSQEYKDMLESILAGATIGEKKRLEKIIKQSKEKSYLSEIKNLKQGIETYNISIKCWELTIKSAEKIGEPIAKDFNAKNPEDFFTEQEIQEKTDCFKEKLQKDKKELDMILKETPEQYFQRCNKRREEEKREEKEQEQYIYFILNTSNNNIKIGYSKNPQKRCAELQTGNGASLKVLFKEVVREHRKIEQELHSIFSDRRIGKEWFHLTPKDIQQGIIIIKEKKYSLTLKKVLK